MGTSDDVAIGHLGRVARSDEAVEWAFPPTGDRLCQGDVLASSESSELAMILTADCDLAQRKNYGRLLCVPTLTLESYVMSYRCESLINEMIESTHRTIREIVNHQCLSLGGVTVSESRLRSWVLEAECSELFSALEIRPESAEAKKLDMCRSTLVAASRETCSSLPDLLVVTKKLLSIQWNQGTRKDGREQTHQCNSRCDQFASQGHLPAFRGFNVTQGWLRCTVTLPIHNSARRCRFATCEPKRIEMVPGGTN